MDVPRWRLASERAPHEYLGKRCLDLTLGLAFAVCTAPITLVCALVSAVVFRAWPFFVQYREGRDGLPFRFVKVRSLPTSTPQYADRQQLAAHETSRWGEFIRDRHLDELPQFWHVVSGSMSLVGPRPMIAGICERMEDEFRLVRHGARPGVTGLWQISEDGTRLVIEATHYDENYLEWASLRLDLWIIIETARQVLGKPRLSRKDLLLRVSLAIDTDVTGGYPRGDTTIRETETELDESAPETP